MGTHYPITTYVKRFTNCKHTPALRFKQKILAVKTPLFWYLTLCSLVDTDQCFKGTCCIHLHSLKKEAAGSSEMLVNIYHTTRATFHKPIIFRGHSSENLKYPCNVHAWGSDLWSIPHSIHSYEGLSCPHQTPQFLHRCQQFLSTNITFLKSTPKPQVRILEVLDVFFNQSMSTQIQGFQSANISKSEIWHRNS
jgi:hypothetical protein